jgi:enoyl-CoA hydratase
MDAYADYQLLEFERQDGVLTVSLAPKTPLNSVNGQLHAELATVFATIRRDPSVDAVVLTGENGAFSAGAEVSWLHGLTIDDLDPLFDEGYRIVMDLIDLPQPIIAAIEGPAVGLGATIALFCDVKFAAADARIGDPHVRIGVVAGDGGAVIWPWLIGVGRAKRYLLTGDLVDAELALEYGLIDEVVPSGESLGAARAFAGRLAGGNQAAIRGTKACVNKHLRQAANLVLDTSLALEKETMSSSEHQHALQAFLDKSKK